MWATLISTLALAFSVLLSYVFFMGALHKWRRAEQFQSVLIEYDLTPHYFLSAQVMLLCVLEFMTSLSLLLPSLLPLGAGLALVLLVVYILAIVVNLIRDNNISRCGCGGSEQPLALSPWLVFRNIFLLCGAAGLLLLDAPAEGVVLPAILMGGVLVILYQAFEQWLWNNSKLTELRGSHG